MKGQQKITQESEALVIDLLRNTLKRKHLRCSRAETRRTGGTRHKQCQQEVGVRILLSC